MADLRLLAQKHGIPPDALRRLAEAKADYFMLHSGIGSDERSALFLGGEWPDRLADGLLTLWSLSHPLRATLSPRAARLDADREGRPVDFEAIARDAKGAAARTSEILARRAAEEKAGAERAAREREESARRDEVERQRRQEVRAKEKRLEEVRLKRLEAEAEERELEARLADIRPQEPREAPEERRFDLSM